MKWSWILLAVVGLSWPLACAKPPQERGHKRVLVLGDSLTEGHGLEATKVFPAKLEILVREKGFPEVSVTADGISGSTSDTGYGRLLAHYEAGERIDILVLALGANDGLRGMDLEALRGHLTRTIVLAQAKGTKVVLGGMKIPPHNGVRYMKDFQDLFSDLAKEQGVALIPFLLEDVAAHPKLNLDGMYPNEAGHQIVAKTVFKALEPLL
jgi:acyl-CoA thioesterase-1